MKENELRSKIAEVVRLIIKKEKLSCNSHCWCVCTIDMITSDIVDALIGANIVTEIDIPALIEGTVDIAVQGKGFMRLYNELEIKKLKYTVRKLEKALKFLSHKIALGDISTPIVAAMEREEQEALQNAEKELSEENSAKKKI